jgi:hypothetical protein
VTEADLRRDQKVLAHSCVEKLASAYQSGLQDLVVGGFVSFEVG